MMSDTLVNKLYQEYKVKDLVSVNQKDEKYIGISFSAENNYAIIECVN